jgi:hypothetical protein
LLKSNDCVAFAVVPGLWFSQKSVFQFDSARVPAMPAGANGRYELILDGVDTAADIVRPHTS